MPKYGERVKPAIVVGSGYYIVWAKERKEWIGFFYEEDFSGHLYESAGQAHDEITTRGPYRLDERCALAIKSLSKKKNMPLEQVLKSSPEELGFTE